MGNAATKRSGAGRATGSEGRPSASSATTAANISAGRDDLRVRGAQDPAEPQLTESCSPRLPQDGSTLPNNAEELQQLRASVERSVRNLEEKLQGQGSCASTSEAEDLMGELKDSLQAAEEGVGRAQAAADQQLRTATANSEEALRKSATEATVLRMKLHRCDGELRRMRSEVAQLKQERDQLRQDLAVQLGGLQTWCAEMMRQSVEHTDRAGRAEAQPATQQAAGQVVSSGAHELSLLRDLAVRQFEARRELVDKLVEASGPFRVLCRIRGLMPEEQSGGQQVVVQAASDSTVIVHGTQAMEKMYRVGRVLGEAAGQDAVCRELLPLIEAAVLGSSVAVLVYGSQKSGKSHTVLGTPGEPGLFMLALGEVYSLTEERQLIFETSVGLSMLQMSDDFTWDLLGHDGCTPGAPEDAVHPAYADSLSEAVMMLDNGVRAMDSSPLQDRPSFSCLLTIFVTSKNRCTGEEMSGKLQVVMMATSTAQGLKDAPSSVLLLGECIIGRLKHQQVPWNSSLLTMLLSDSLATPSPKAAILVTVSPSAAALQESVATLNFASRCYAATPAGAPLGSASVSDMIQRTGHEGDQRAAPSHAAGRAQSARAARPRTSRSLSDRSRAGGGGTSTRR